MCVCASVFLFSTVIVGGVLAGVVLVGLILLIAWKICTTIKDRKEYADFLTEKKAAAWTDVSMIIGCQHSVLLFKDQRLLIVLTFIFCSTECESVIQASQK